MTSQLQTEAAAPTVAATLVPMQGVVEAFTAKPNSEKAGQAQVDADIFDALFSKWGQDAATEEANIGSSFDDLLWDEGTATAAAAATSLGWQRSGTPLNLLSSSKAEGSEQQQQQQWNSALSQQQQQEKQFAREYLLSSSQVASGPSNGEQDTSKQQQQSRSVMSAQPANSNSCSDAQGRTQSVPALHPPAAAEAAAKARADPAGASDLQYSVQAMQQLLTGGCPAPGPAAAAPAAIQQAEEVAAGSQHMLNALNTAQQQLTMQQLQFSAAFSGVAAGGEAGRVLPQLSMQAMLHLQQQMLTETNPAHQQSWKQHQQQVQQPQQAHKQQQPVPMNSIFAYESGAQQLSQQAHVAAVSSWPQLPAAAVAVGMGAVPATSVGPVADTALQASAWQQQQQQQARSAGLPAGLPFPGAGPGPGPGLLGNIGLSNQPASTPFGFPPLPGPHLLGNQAALYAAAQASSAAWQTHLLQQKQAPQQQQQHVGAQQAGEQPSANLQAAATASSGDQNPLMQQSLSALLGVIGNAAGPAGAAGQMGPPAPHAPNMAAATITATATGGAMLPLPQQQPHMSHLLQPMLPPDLLSALGLGPMGQAACGPAGAAGLAPLFPGSWQMQLAGLLRPPPVHATSFLQLAMMMQAAMQASALSGGADTQQAAMAVAALQGLACNMRMMMPWNSPPAWQQQPQQQQLNGSCLANGPMLHRQLSSSYGIGGQKATMQFGSQPQTSTTDISGQGLPGCHSHSTAVAGYAAAGAGEKAEPAPRSKQKRKVRHNDNRARYEGRKVRANNRMRIKGRFVKMGPNGEPILPGEIEAAEAETHTAVTHSDHDGSDAELSDPETHEHPGSSGMPPAAAAALRGSAAGGSEQAGQATEPEPVMPPAGDTAEMAISGDSYGGPAATRAGFRAVPGADAGTDTFLQKAGSQTCYAGAAGACEVCRASPAAGDRPCPRSMDDEGGHGGQQAMCCAPDRALGHADDGPCCCCDHQHRSQSPAAHGKTCGVSSTSGLREEEGNPGENSNRLPRPQQRPASSAAAGVAGVQSLSNCSEPHAPDVQMCLTAAEVTQQGKRQRAAVNSEEGDVFRSSSKRQAVEEVLNSPDAALGSRVAAGASKSHAAKPQAAAVGPSAGVVNAAECTVMSDVQQQQTAELETAATALDPAEAAAAMVAADVVEQQHQILVRQASEAVAAETAAVVQAEAAAQVPDTDLASVKASTAASSRQQVQQLPAAVVGPLPAAGAAQPAAALHPQPPAAALLNQLAAASHPALQQWSAVHAVSHVLHPSTAPLPAQLPGSMLPPAARPPAGVWGHNGVAALGALSAVHAAVRPGLAAGADMGMQLPTSADMLAGTPFAAMQPTAAAGLGPGESHGLHMGLAPWALQQHMMGPPGQHLLSPASSLAAAAVRMAGLPLVRPGAAVVGGGQPLLGPQLVPVALPGGWPLAAAVAGKWVAPRVGRQRRRGGKNAKEGSEQTDSCLNC